MESGYLAGLRGRRQARVGPVVPAQRHAAGQDFVVEFQAEDRHEHGGGKVVGGRPGWPAKRGKDPLLWKPQQAASWACEEEAEESSRSRGR